MKATIYPMVGEPYTADVSGLRRMQEIVGGLIEVVYGTREVIIVDEEGLCKGKEINIGLSERAGQPLVGTGFVVSTEDWDAQN